MAYSKLDVYNNLLFNANIEEQIHFRKKSDLDIKN